MKTSELLALAGTIYLAPQLSRKAGVLLAAALCVASFVFDHWGR